jgi:hypothetical protein
MQPPTAAASQEAVLKLIPSDEERQMREAVRGICSGFGPEYQTRLHEQGESPVELWEAWPRRAISA